jgi:tRNA nucleotidyltransferase (CCA-adding enzyme)
MMQERFPERAVIRLNSLTGMKFISPRITVTRRLSALYAAIRRECLWFTKRCTIRRHIDLRGMYLAALFSGLTRSEASALCGRFGFGREESGKIIAYVGSRRKAQILLSRSAVSPSALFHLLDPLPDEAVLLIRASSSSRSVKRHSAEFLVRLRGTCVSISGHDLQRLGIMPGPEYKRIFRRLLDAKLAGRIATRDDELAFVGGMKTRKDSR